jgi:hypothetical protein
MTLTVRRNVEDMRFTSVVVSFCLLFGLVTYIFCTTKRLDTLVASIASVSWSSTILLGHAFFGNTLPGLLVSTYSMGIAIDFAAHGVMHDDSSSIVMPFFHSCVTTMLPLWLIYAATPLLVVKEMAVRMILFQWVTFLVCMICLNRSRFGRNRPFSFSAISSSTK